MCTVCTPAGEKLAFLGTRGKSAATPVDDKADLVQARNRISKFKLQRAAQKLLPEETTMPRVFFFFFL